MDNSFLTCTKTVGAVYKISSPVYLYAFYQKRTLQKYKALYLFSMKLNMHDIVVSIFFLNHNKACILYLQNSMLLYRRWISILNIYW